jgi:ATP-binding cassette subfamily B protein
MTQKPGSRAKVFLRLLSFAKPYRLLLVLAFIGTLSLALIATYRPKLVGSVIQKYVVNEETRNQHQFTFWIIIICSMLLLEALLQFSSAYFSNLFAQKIIRDMRVRVFSHLTTFRMHYFDKTPVGNLVTRVVSDIEAISEVFSAGLIEIFGDLLILVFILTYMFVQDWYLAILCLVPIPLLIIATRIFAKAMRKSFQQESSAVARLNTFIQERLTGMSIVQLFNREKKEMKAFEEANRQHRTAHINAVWAFSIFFPVVEILSSLSLAFLIVWIAMKTGNKTFENTPDYFERVVSFTLYIQMVYRPIRQLADKFNILQRGIVRAERVLETIDTKEHQQDAGTITDCNFQAPIHLKNVSFAYVDEQWVLKDINLTIPEGKMVAFVGATGAGKTSIVNLLGRFYDYQKGEITVGNTELRQIDLNTLRKNIAIVLQDVFLFSDTIHNNITLGNEEITREQVIASAKVVGAHDFIEKLPGGYDFVVGERGGILSVGQRQLLAFIRAYVYNPHILILDEATSSVDSESEVMIQNATRELTKGRTSIVIAHRLSTIKAADTIVVLDKGQIMESGSHNELLQKDGYYKRLFDMQFSKDEYSRT